MPRVVESVEHPHRPDVSIFGFSALASASARVVLSTGRPDYGLVRDEVLAHPRSLSAATDLPVNADYESGFGADIDDLSASVRLAVEAGVSGLKTEISKEVRTSSQRRPRRRASPRRAERHRSDWRGRDPGGAHGNAAGRSLHDIVGDRQARCLRRRGRGLPIRTSCAGEGRDCIDRKGGRAEAGEIVMMLMMRQGFSLGELADLGVRRVNIGGALARVAWASVVSLMDGIANGSFDGLAVGIPGKEPTTFLRSSAQRTHDFARIVSITRRNLRFPRRLRRMRKCQETGAQGEKNSLKRAFDFKRFESFAIRIRPALVAIESLTRPRWNARRN